MVSASGSAAARIVGLLVGVLLAASAGPAFAADPVVAAAGDIACDPIDAWFNGGLGTASACRQKYTSDLLVSGSYDAVLALGDNQYETGALSSFQNSYALSWGRTELKAKTYPAIGNHEGTTATGGSGYCSYFGAAAHCNSSNTEGGAAFYSWDIGAWHVVAVNSNCTAAGGCDVGSPQYTWLNQDLTQHPTTCTLAYWHHPRWSSGLHGSNVFMQPIWKLLYDKGADLVLTGHDHDYERFAPLDGDGALNPSNGMREFVVGTGGKSLRALSTPIANSEARQANTFGVLRLVLHAAGYDFSFLSESGKPFADSGSGACRGSASADTTPPSTPTGLSATGQTATSISLSWNASTDNVGVTDYDISVDGGASISTNGATSFTATGLTCGTSHTFTVAARDAAGKISPRSAPVRATTDACSPPPPSSIALVRQATGKVRRGTKFTVPLASAAGDALVASIAVKAGRSVSVSSVSDSSGVSWTRGPIGFLTGSNTRVELWYRAGASAVTGVTVTLSRSNRAAANVSEWSGVAATAALDAQAGAGSAASTTAQTPLLATTNASDLVIGAVNWASTATATLTSTTFAPLDSFSVSTTVNGRAAYHLPSLASSLRATWTLSTATASGGAILALKGA